MNLHGYKQEILTNPIIKNATKKERFLIWTKRHACRIRLVTDKVRPLNNRTRDGKGQSFPIAIANANAEAPWIQIFILYSSNRLD